jgi:hypothetical protein
VKGLPVGRVEAPKRTGGSQRATHQEREDEDGKVLFMFFTKRLILKSGGMAGNFTDFFSKSPLAPKTDPARP